MTKEWTETIDGEEVKYVDYAWYEFEKEKMLFELCKFCGGWDNQLVNIYDKPRIFLDGLNPIEMWVNWSAIGTVDTERAKYFQEQLNKAIEMAENFKYNGYVISHRMLNDDMDYDYTAEEQAEIKAAYKAAGLD